MTILLEFVASVDEPKLIRRIKKCQTAEFAGGLFVESSGWVEIIDAGRL